MLIKLVYKVDSLRCPKCGEEMKIISFIGRQQSEVIERILRYCNLWKDNIQRSPPQKEKSLIVDFEEPHNDYTFFDRVCA